MKPTPSLSDRHAELLANRLKKNLRRLAPKFASEDVTVFRVYDRDIPEIRAAVDWYEGHAVISVFRRTQTDALTDYVPRLVEGAAAGLGIDEERVHARLRKTGAGVRYTPGPKQGIWGTVREHGLRFHVNLTDYLDCGLFCDHRRTRLMIRRSASGRHILNLFGYTGSFSVAAAAGGAAFVTTVDASDTYLRWAGRNLELNRLPLGALVRADVYDFLQGRKGRRDRWDVVIVDPPSYSTRFGLGSFRVQSDHRRLVAEAFELVKPGGELYFSTNHQRFIPDLEGVGRSVAELTDELIPADFRQRSHRTFRLEK